MNQEDNGAVTSETKYPVNSIWNKHPHAFPGGNCGSTTLRQRSLQGVGDVRSEAGEGDRVDQDDSLHYSNRYGFVG